MFDDISSDDEERPLGWWESWSLAAVALGVTTLVLLLAALALLGIWIVSDR